MAWAIGLLPRGAPRRRLQLLSLLAVSLVQQVVSSPVNM